MVEVTGQEEQSEKGNKKFLNLYSTKKDALLLLPSYVLDIPLELV